MKRRGFFGACLGLLCAPLAFLKPRKRVVCTRVGWERRTDQKGNPTWTVTYTLKKLPNMDSLVDPVGKTYTICPYQDGGTWEGPSEETS